MRIAVVQMYGLGNAMLTTPLIRALRSMGHDIDVIVEKGRAAYLVFQGWEVIDHLWLEKAPPDCVYDMALFCHPKKLYVSRCHHLRADEISVPKSEQGYMWGFEKHEVEYLMDMARRLGYQGTVPELRVPSPQAKPIIPRPSVAIGIGYLKSHAQWKKKHWGNGNYADLVKALYSKGWTPILVGDKKDKEDARAIERLAPVVLNSCGTMPFTQLVGLLEECDAYVGNDSGLMHVAAGTGIPTLGIFQVTNPVKNRPWTEKWRVLTKPTVAEVVDQLQEVLRETRSDDSLHLQECNDKPLQGG